MKIDKLIRGRFIDLVWFIFRVFNKCFEDLNEYVNVLNYEIMFFLMNLDYGMYERFSLVVGGYYEEIRYMRIR